MKVLLPSSSSPHLIRISKPFFAFLFLILINLLLITDSQNLQSPPHPEKETDLLALLAFKDKITQDPFGALNSWNSSHHFCGWQGITCSPPHQRVTNISLQSQAIGGTISPHIGNLTFLRFINLENNSFHGEIPHEIGYLSRLVRLRLSNNSFNGQIIPSGLSNCSNLIDIHLSSNNLTGNLPAELGSLSKLRILSIRLNNLTGSIPPSFGNLSSLKHLTLNYNNLEGNFPESLGKMSSLQYIRIGSNKLSGVIPPYIWNLSSLVEFYVYGNQFHGSLPPSVGFTLPNLENPILAKNNFSGPIPISISNMSRLHYFDIAKNNFFGQVPTDLGQLQNLKWLDLSNNHLKNLSFINALVNCRNLEKLLLDHNQFEGVLPHSIANLSTKLHTLTLGGNQISGNIPEAFENLVNLTRLVMDQNLLTGSIPFSIGKLHNLYQLKLNNNRFSGQIPSSLGNNISQLYELHLQSNKFIGAIPLSLKNIQRLRILDLSDNDLNGTIPGEVIGSFSQLTDLNLSYNSFTGSLPTEVGKMVNLQVFDVARNRFSDKIPSTLGDCSRLEKLLMQGNKFQGNLSSFLNKLKALQYVDLSLNNLSGEVPKDLESFSLLRNLNLSFNDLQGEIPTGGVFSNSSVSFIVGNENLCGGIPKLKLPTCLGHEPNKDGMSSASSKVIIVVPIVILSLILAILFVVLYWRRSSRNQQPAPPISFEGDTFSRVSYEDLRKATNGFSLSNLIGTGSFGFVYKGTLQQVETPVAVKVLNLQQTGAAKSFIAECEALTKVRHRNLIKIITACSSIDSKGNGFKALVFKFISNGSLESWLHPSSDCQQEESNKKLSFGQRLSIALDVAYALDYLHHHCQTPIAHCDLKPSNVLLDDDLTAHVSDFGLAKLISLTRKNSQIDDTSTVGIRGSIGYIAPEYGMGGVASTNGDIYSYGILLLEMFTGRRPVDEMFKDGLNLHEFSKMALPERVMEIIDPSLLLQFSEEDEQDEGKAKEKHQIVDTREHYRKNRREECLVSLISIGVACSVESQVDRINITDVIKKLLWIKDVYSQDTIRFQYSMAIE